MDNSLTRSDQSSARATKRSQRAIGWTATRIATTAGAAGPVAFLATATLVGLLTPGYDTRTQTLSELALGTFGWLQAANFVAFGLAITCFAVALFRGLGHPSHIGTALLTLAGVAVAASGYFPTDPPGAAQTGSGALHNLLFLVAFLALILAAPFIAAALRRAPELRGLAPWVAITPVAVIALLVAFVGFGADPGDPLHGVAGLLQRALVAVAFGWLPIAGWQLLTRRA